MNRERDREGEESETHVQLNEFDVGRRELFVLRVAYAARRCGNGNKTAIQMTS